MKNRRVVINGRYHGRPVTGVERFAVEIGAALDRLVGEQHPLTRGIDFVLALPPGETQPVPFRHIGHQVVGRFTGYAWEQIDLARFAGRDVVMNFGNIAPLLASRSITTVHDAHVWLVPDNFSLAFRLAYRVLLPLSIRRSRHWTTVSHYSDGQLRRFKAANRPASAVTYNGADHSARWDAARASLNVENLPERFVFALGSRSHNKNIAMIRGLAPHLAAQGLSVVLAGGGNSAVFGKAGDASDPAVVELGRISDDDIALVLSKAVACLFPSFHEGFGLPPVEAMTHGCPVIASATSAMPEILGDAAILVDPNDPQAWLSAVLDLARNEDLRRTLVARGHEQAARYTWRDSALVLLDLIHRTEAA